jgi:type I restriction enzyme S subunit
MKKDAWLVTTLGSLFKIKHGFAFRGEYFSDQGNYILLTPGNFYDEGGFKAKEGKERYYSGEFPPEYILRKGDIIIVMTEQKEGLLGSPAIIPKNSVYLHNQRLGLITDVDSTKIDKRFIYFLFNFRPIRAQISSTANGTKVRHTSPSRIYAVQTRIPPLKIQQKIVFILSAYDDLIRNNNDRIQILEQMAKLIYDEWFVKFKFPGHEKAKMVSSELGEIPEGWSIVEVGKQFKVTLGGTPSRNKPEFWDGEIPWINSGKVNDLRIIEKSEGISKLGLEKSATKMMPRRTTVIAITGATLGQVSLTEIEVCANQSVVGVYDESKLFSEYIYLKIDCIIESIILKAGGGAQQHINKEIVEETMIILPNQETIRAFNVIIRPIFDELTTLMFKNQNLARTRNILLPKLISGQIDVSELDIKVPQVDA